MTNATSTSPSPWLRVFSYGTRAGTSAFAKMWPAPVTLAFGGVAFAEASGPELPGLIDIIDQVVRQPNRNVQTIVLDIWTPLSEQMNPAISRIWRDEHRRFFQYLFSRLPDRHAVVLAGERPVNEMRNGALIEARRIPYAPSALESLCDVVLHNVGDGDHSALLARCLKHNRVQGAECLTTTWDADRVLGIKKLP